MSKVDMKQLAGFIEEGLATTGVSDDADEIIGYIFDDDGLEAARKAFDGYNNAIAFIREHGSDHAFLTEEEFKDWTDQS